MKSLVSILLLISSSAWAYQIESASYDNSSMTVTVNLVYQGGEKQHHFAPEFEACNRETLPFGLAVRLVDSGWDDTGTQELRQTVQFALPDNSCAPADLTIRASRSHVTIPVF